MVKMFQGDNEERWVMWYNGRAGGPHPEILDSGCIGVATSSDGVNWKRGVGRMEVTGDRQPSFDGSEVGSVMQPNEEDWWTFDTCHVGVGDVQILSSGTVQASGGVYWMFYYGGDYNEDEAEDGSETVLTGLRTRPGLALSQDGLNFARIEGDHYTGALFDFGKEGEWDSLGISKPQVVMLKNRDMLMFFQGRSSPSDPFSIGLAKSSDGFRWEKKGKVFGPGPPGSFDCGGVARPYVLPLPPSKGGGFVMYYEARDQDGVRSIGGALSKDGMTWKRAKDGPVFSRSQVDRAWDAGTVRSPCPVLVGGGKLRLYYGGSSKVHEPSQGVGMALSDGEDMFSFTRFEGVN
eukprot:CAMPEP_0196587670 /NCGR_PEP_ID=MMETSP1081-20130531/58212_1 /TAXON_ID=36882 /ORGANISM="Pyramimonas amylifera, Strain CCMP720" /LENGTH=347 /DNA_ID=CAMNT_0041909917 /DNA_START=349 /DNA_END=1392 /DNA_ORIENTATION=+